LLAAASATLGAAWAATPAHASRLGLEPAHSPNAEDISTSYWVMLGVAVALVLAINAALIVAILRFREQRGREPSRFAAGRGALRPVVAGLSLLALAVFVFGILTTTSARDVEPSGPNGLGAGATAQVGVSGASTTAGAEPSTGQTPAGDPTAQSGPLVVNAIGQQWLWRFEYPGGRPGQRTFSYGELVVPVDTAVLLNVTSTDVVHTWWVPALGGQVEAVPGSTAETWFKADEVGRYRGASTAFSGTGYPVMRAWVRVVTVPEYQDYIERLDQDLTEAQGFVEQRQLEQAQPSQVEEGGVP